MLKSGLDMVEVINSDEITKLVKVALPHHKEYIEKYGHSAFHYFLDELELALLHELGNILKGVKSDKESIERAALILREADRLMEANASMQKND